MRIIDLTPNSEPLIQQAARLLVEAFAEHAPAAWPDMAAALEEVHEALAADRICLGAVDADGALRGWIGGSPEYELHTVDHAE